MCREQLHGLGLSDKQIRRREADGELHELYTDVGAVGRRKVTPLGNLIAAMLSCGPASFLSHRTAAALHGLSLKPPIVCVGELDLVGSGS